MASVYDLIDNLDEEIERLQEELKKLDPASDEYRKVSQRRDEAMKLRVEQHTADMESAERTAKSEAELALREKELTFSEKQHEDDVVQKKKDRISGWIHTGVDVALTIVRVGGTVLGTKLMLDQGYSFETTGAPVSGTFREGRKKIADALSSLVKKK